MNNQKIENLQEQYDDALVALIMDEYTEAEGAMLVKEFEEADARGEVPEVPADLDAACRKMIYNHFSKKQRAETVRRVVKTIAKSAAMLFIVLGFASVLIFSVEAFRTPVINFFLEQHEHFSVIGHGNSDKLQQGNDEHLENDDSPLAGLLPNGYNCVRYKVKENGTVFAHYQNADGHIALFQTNHGNGALVYDSEGAECEPAKVLDNEGLLVKKDGYNLIWYSAEKDVTYQLYASDLFLDEVWQIAEKIASNEKEG